MKRKQRKQRKQRLQPHIGLGSGLFGYVLGGNIASTGLAYGFAKWDKRGKRNELYDLKMKSKDVKRYMKHASKAKREALRKKIMSEVGSVKNKKVNLGDFTMSYLKRKKLITGVGVSAGLLSGAYLYKLRRASIRRKNRSKNR